MTTLTTASPIPSGHVTGQARLVAWNVWKHCDTAPTRLGLAMFALLPVFAAAGLLDPRRLAGVSLWDKPMRFAVGLGIYLVSLGLYAAFVSPQGRARRAYRWPMAAGCAAAALELFVIAMQSARGVGSHYNFATPFDAAVYSAMGIGALVLTAMTLPVAAGIARRPALQPALGTAMRSALVWGLRLTPVLTLITAGTLSAHGGHQVGGVGVPPQVLPLFGWLTTAGDLRVPHFFGTHAMHAVPLAVLCLGAVRPLRRPGVAIVGLLYTLFVLATFAQALAGRPFL